MRRLIKNMVVILFVLLAGTTVQAELQLVVDFEGFTGTVDGLACNGVLGGTVDTESENTGNASYRTQDGSNTMSVIGHSSGGLARAIGFGGIDNPIDDGETGVGFFRFRVDAGNVRPHMGLVTDTEGNPVNSTNTQDPTTVPAGFRLVASGAGMDLVTTDGVTVLRAGLSTAQWYNCWIVADNAADTFDLYISEAAGPAGEVTKPAPEYLVQSNIPFGVATTDPLAGMIFANPTGTGQASRIYVDDIWWDGDQGLSAPVSARNPSPADAMPDVPIDVILSWTPSEFASKHDVYLGKIFDNVNNADASNLLDVQASIGQDANTYEPGILDFGKIYYWRVDEVNAPPDSTVVKGNVWSFKVEPFAYPIPGDTILATASGQEAANQGPEKTIDGSGLVDDQHSIDIDDMWLSDPGDPCSAWIKYELDQPYKLDHMLVWNYNAPSFLVGLGLKEVAVEYSIDDDTWNQLDNVGEFNPAPGTNNYASDINVDFEGVTAKYIKITAVSNHAGGGFFNQYGLSEVRFFYVPILARKPKPADGETNVALDTTLSWRAGREAASHDVYFSSDAEAVINESVTADSVSDSSLPVGPLDFGRTYYWKVNEINDAEEPSLWEGDIWSFITKEYDDIDNFESYTDNDAAGEAIWQAWVDGYEVPNNGSQVGNIDPPYAERTVTHTGNQSMSLNYNNTAGVAYSEAVKTFPSTRNWTVNGADTLLLYYQGIPVRFAELAPDHIIMSGAGTDIYGTADQFRFVYKQLTGDGTLLARVDSLDNTHAWAKAGVMIRETLDMSSAWAMVCYAGENGAHYQARLTTAAGATSDTPVQTADQIAQRAPVWIKIERLGNQFNGYYSQDGQNWTSMVWNPQTINMSSTVYIGLAVTSHTVGVLCGAELSEIQSTGNVTGQWQIADVGVEQASGNSLDTLYVAVEDSAGRKKTVNAEPGAVATGIWTPWPIAISDLAAGGVDMTKVKKMYIGVGDRNNPLHGAGKVYIDDIQFGHAAEE